MRNVLDGFLTAQRGRFVLFLPVFWGAGVVGYFALASEPPLAWALAAALLACAATALAWRRIFARAALLCLAFCTLGFALACAETWASPAWVRLPRTATEVAGRVSAVEALPAGRRITIATPSLDGAPPIGRALRLRLRTADITPVAPGDHVKVRCLLQVPPPPDYPGGRDAQRDAFFAGLAGYGFAIGPVTLVQQAPGSALASAREGIAARIMAVLPGAEGAVAATLLTGLGAAIPAEDRAAFEASGLAHLLAVAGLHIGIVMGLAYAATRLGLAAWEYAALAWPTRKIAALAALAAGFLYLELTGAHLPILRSFAMAALVTLGVLTGRRALSLRGLALAAMVLMAASPDSVMGVSFQMSFAAVLCLIAGAEIFGPFLRRFAGTTGWRRPALYGLGLALSSFLAGTASLPFAAYHFGRATLYYVPANMLAVPLTAFWVLPWGMAALVLMPAGLDAVALVPMGWGVHGLIAIARCVAGWPAANLPVPQWPPWGLACIAAGLALAGLLRGRARLAGLPPLALGLAAPLLVAQPDFFVSPDARLVAIRLNAGVFVEGGDEASVYENFAPARLWASRGLSGPDLPEAGLICTPSSCRTTLHGRKIVLVRDAAGLDCTADVLVSRAWLHGACPRALVVDRGFVQREGAVTVALAEPAPRIVTAFLTRGARPWVITQKPMLPMAQTE